VQLVILIYNLSFFDVLMFVCDVVGVGVPSLINATMEVGGRWASGLQTLLYDAASHLIEEGQGLSINCYSPLCKPGAICYSPTCSRGLLLIFHSTCLV
jgi:hypothetical protein